MFETKLLEEQDYDKNLVNSMNPFQRPTKGGNIFSAYLSQVAFLGGRSWFVRFYFWSLIGLDEL